MENKPTLDQTFGMIVLLHHTIYSHSIFFIECEREKKKAVTNIIKTNALFYKKITTDELEGEIYDNGEKIDNFLTGWDKGNIIWISAEILKRVIDLYPFSQHWKILFRSAITHSRPLQKPLDLTDKDVIAKVEDFKKLIYSLASNVIFVERN